MSYPLIYLWQQKAIPVQQSCRVLEVSRSGFYAVRSRLANQMEAKAILNKSVRVELVETYSL
jgi:hypothetical protein